MYEGEIQAAVDRHMEMERKARAWDELLVVIDNCAPSLPAASWAEVEKLRALVHPAQKPSNC